MKQNHGQLNPPPSKSSSSLKEGSPLTINNHLTKKLLSLFGFLEQLGWMIASEDPNSPNTFKLRHKTEIRLGKPTISRTELEKFLMSLKDKTFLHKEDNIVIWRELRKVSHNPIPLTRREQEIHNNLISGDSISTIASELGISRRTVEKHVERIYKKCDVNSHNELLFCTHQSPQA